MTTQHDPRTRTGGLTHCGHQHGHGWVMIAYCIPTLVIAVILVATGIVRPFFLVAAVGCTLMMAVMVGGMSPAEPTRPSGERLPTGVGGQALRLPGR